ncbi:hypothetical protein Hdeb2414_s0017g00506301 [Helianthus debilis subsp. tardiflorus]
MINLVKLHNVHSLFLLFLALEHDHGLSELQQWRCLVGCSSGGGGGGMLPTSFSEQSEQDHCTEVGRRYWRQDSGGATTN